MLTDVKWDHGRACNILYPIISIEIDILVDLSFMLVWLTKPYLSFNASLIERHKHLPQYRKTIMP